MLYLASRFVWFLVAAFGLGLVMGWIGHEGRGAVFKGRSLFYALGLWALGAALVLPRIVNGAPALLIETALLFLAVYFAGCVLAVLLRGVNRADALAPAGAARLDEATFPGLRPAALAAARDGRPDDLKLIKGVGRQNEARLHGLGIWHFSQIAHWTPENVEWVGGYLAFPGRIEREDWVAQAAALASGEETEFAARARAGLVETSRDDGTSGQGNVATLSDDSFEGQRPDNLLPQPRGGRPDDLTLIKGVGPALAADLNALGIWHFDQLADLRDAEIRYVSARIGAPGRGLDENWREDADILKYGGETAHSRAVKAGKHRRG